MSARAIALGDRMVVAAFDAANYRAQATEGPGAYRDPTRCLKAVSTAFGDRPGVFLVKGGNDVMRVWAGHRDELTAAGWTCTAIEPWTTWKHPERPAVHVGHLGAIDYDRIPLFTQHDRPHDVVRRLAWAEQAIGAPYHMTPGVTGHAAIRGHYAETRRSGKHRNGRDFSEPYWGVGTKRDHEDKRLGSGDLIWHRRPTRADITAGWVHSYDLNAARLSAAGVAELGWGKLVRAEDPSFDPRRAGYWLIHAADVNEPFPGAIVDQADVHGGLVWLTTPMMEFLSQLGQHPPVTEAWTATGRRVLRPIAEKWNAARQAAPPGPALDTVKAVYREAAGLFARDGGSIVRHDWYHTIMDRQRATLLSHILKVKRSVGILPLVVHTDCLWYPSDDEDPARAADRLGLRIGTNLGTFRINSTATAAAFYKKKG